MGPFLRTDKPGGSSRFTLVIVIGILTCALMAMKPLPWGFYAHRMINRMAVFILPTEMISVFKANIEFVTEHAVDPDKRRYATEHEAVRHYMDLDHWGKAPFDSLPREWTDAIAQNLSLYCLSEGRDTLLLYETHHDYWGKNASEAEAYAGVRAFTRTHVLPGFYEDVLKYPRDTIRKYFPGIGLCPDGEILVRENFSEHGILPYHLLVMYRRLTNAFADMDQQRILRLAAEIGHYIGDAHVPLHTTKNYNGQLTGQEGIHAFWESRIPELFAGTEYDFWVGTATYVEDPPAYFWEMTLQSHACVEEVLEKEMEVRKEVPADRQFCFDERLGSTILTQCREYADAYRNAMDGMVENRMRQAVRALGNVWYSAWVDAGQPDLDKLVYRDPTEEEILEDRQLDARYRQGVAKGRKHQDEKFE